MATLKGPLMSMEASGSVAGQLTFAKWKGRPYVRSLVVPANPKSKSQTATRSMMRFLTQAWAALNTVAQGSWKTLADSMSFSPFNAFVQANMKVWTQLDSPSQATPAAKAHTAGVLGNESAAGGVGQLTGALTITTLNQNWGVIIYADTSAITPARSQARLVLPAGTAKTYQFSLTGLNPGTYHVEFQSFTDDGVKSALTATGLTAIVT